MIKNFSVSLHRKNKLSYMAIFANIRDESVIEAEKILIENGVQQEKAADILFRIGKKLLLTDLFWNIK